MADSLVRLAAVAGDAQAAIDEVAGELLERALIHNDAGRVALDCRLLTGRPRHLVRELFVALWRRQNWPQRDMGYREWDQLADLALAATARKVTLPGGIEAERLGEELSLGRR